MCFGAQEPAVDTDPHPPAESLGDPCWDLSLVTPQNKTDVLQHPAKDHHCYHVDSACLITCHHFNLFVFGLVFVFSAFRGENT